MTTMDAHTLDGHLFGPGQPCFGCSPDHPFGFRLQFAREGDEVVTRFTPGSQHQGPLGIMHGGLVSTLADEVAAWSVIAILGKFGFTTNFEANLHRPIRIGIPIEARSRVTRDARRIVEVAVSIHQETQRAFSGTFKFVILDAKGAEQMLGQPIPEHWKRFCR